MSMYSGFWASCGRNCVFNSCYFATIFYMKENWLTPPIDVTSQVTQSLLSGLAGGLVATAFKMPFDIVKSRMQSQVPDAVTRNVAGWLLRTSTLPKLSLLLLL